MPPVLQDHWWYCLLILLNLKHVTIAERHSSKYLILGGTSFVFTPTNAPIAAHVAGEALARHLA